MRSRTPELLLLFTFVLATSQLVACGSDAPQAAGSGGMGGTDANGFGGAAFNQCGVAAPLPAETGQCAAVNTPTITNFDDYMGGAASSYSFYVNGKPPAQDAVLGAVLHVGDGSDMNGGTGVITTEMVTGNSGAGYALEIANTNAMHWGGFLSFYFPQSGSSATCLDGRKFSGLKFSVRGSSPSGRFGVSLGMLDTIPKSDGGQCDSANASDCKDATLQLKLPSDAATWFEVQIPWSAFTPGIGSGLLCVPVTGQNIARVVVQPFMNYPPPDYVFAAGAYTLAVDNVQFY